MNINVTKVNPFQGNRDMLRGPVFKQPTVEGVNSHESKMVKDELVYDPTNDPSRDFMIRPNPGTYPYPIDPISDPISGPIMPSPKPIRYPYPNPISDPINGPIMPRPFPGRRPNPIDPIMPNGHGIEDLEIPKMVKDGINQIIEGISNYLSPSPNSDANTQKVETEEVKSEVEPGELKNPDGNNDLKDLRRGVLLETSAKVRRPNMNSF